MSVIGSVVVRRAGGAYRDSARKYKVLIDGVHRGDLKKGEQLSFVVPPGMHSVVARLDKWWRSPEILIDVAPGQVLTLNVAPGGSAWTAIFQLFTPHSYLKLWPESAHFGYGTPTD
ncbi:MAG: hypothetical protein ABIM89_07645 [Mycobacteriales bacterium]